MAALSQEGDVKSSVPKKCFRAKYIDAQIKSFFFLTAYYEVKDESGSKYAPQTVPKCNSTQDQHSLKCNLKIAN